MAKPLTASRVMSLLAAEGLTIKQVRNWPHHNRNHKGAWGPVHGVMLHHTGNYSSTQQMVELCYEGRSDLPGPLCHGVIDKQGTVHMVGHGRANHAGAGDGDVLRAVIAEAPLPAANQANTDGNTHYYGFECVNRGDGEDRWPAAQVEAMVRASAALLRGHGWGKEGKTSVLGHLEWQPGKIDPRGPGFPGMAAIRERVAERLRHGPGWSPQGTTYTVRQGDTLSSIAEKFDTTWFTLWDLNRKTIPDPDVITPGQVIRIN